MEKFANQFSFLPNIVYADTASCGLPHTNLLQWRKDYDNQFFHSGSVLKNKRYELVSETKQTVANFFGSHRHEVALTTNFSVGLNLLLDGLSRTHSVLLLADDYPSVNWPFEVKGFPCHYVPINATLETNILAAIEKYNITVLALSIVQWTNGIRVSLTFLETLKKEYPSLLIIADGTQFCGTTTFDFRTSGIDVLAASAYKWMVSGYGCGFVLVKEQVRHLFSLKSIGFNAANGDLTKKSNIPFMKHLEPGHLDAFNFGCLNLSLLFLKSFTSAVIENNLQELSRYALDQFSELGLLETSVLERKEHSTIFNCTGDDRLFHRLTSENIICSQRAEGIRFSFHCYNTREDIDRIVNILKTSC